jgi:CRISPR-associated protein Csx14
VKGAQTFAVNVDVANPGQFFACCGLLEMSARLWPGAEGWFEDRSFCVSAPSNEAGLSVLMKRVLAARAGPGAIHGTVRDSQGKPVDPAKVLPIHIGEPFNLRIAWWLDELRGSFSPLKLWSGRQSSRDVFDKLRKAANGRESFDESILELAEPLKSRFGVDPRSAWETLGVGFSPNKQGMTVATHWATELLAAFALNSCVPRPDGDRLCYATWARPLPAIVARAVVAGALDAEGTRQFAFNLVKRGSFDGFGFARPDRR